MVKTFSKPEDARQVEARARARTLRVRVEVVSEARHYRTRSQSQPGEVYQLVRTPAGWACSCQGYEYTGMCKHLGQVERRAAREGWRFGAIAPLSRVARYFPLDDPDPQPPGLPAAEARARPRRPGRPVRGGVMVTYGECPCGRTATLHSGRCGVCRPCPAPEASAPPSRSINDYLQLLCDELAEGDVPEPLGKSFTTDTVTL